MAVIAHTDDGKTGAMLVSISSRMRASDTWAADTAIVSASSHHRLAARIALGTGCRSC